MPLLSVVIPTFRRRDLLARCLRALDAANQDIPGHEYEVIVADDENSAETRRLVQDVLPGAVYIKGPGKGPAANRNEGAARAQGKWLVFTDDDCIPGRGWLASFVSAIHDTCKVYEGRTTCSDGLRSPLDVAPINETGGWLWSCNFMIERRLFLDLGGFDELFPFPAMEDTDLRERIRARKIAFEFVHAALVDHPPRKLTGLPELIRNQRSYIYYEVVKQGRVPGVLPVMIRMLKFRIRSCLRPGIRDLPSATLLYFCESVWLCFRFRYWRDNAFALGGTFSVPGGSRPKTAEAGIKTGV